MKKRKNKTIEKASFAPKPPVVITTIFPPNKVIAGYVKLGHHVIAVGDYKTPSNWKFKNSSYISIDDQMKGYKKFATLVAKNHYARKNFGFLEAMKISPTILETDDDNFPYAFFPNFLDGKATVESYSSSTKFLNSYQLLLKKSHNIWPRGFPLPQILEPPKYRKKKFTGKFLLQQALVNEDTDVDAIYRLTDNTHVEFKPNKKFALEPHTYVPLNTQNTYWQKEAYILMYLPSTVSSRVCDIYRGWIAQRLLWELNGRALVLSPSVYQKRNPHNYLKDFKEEVPLYTHTEEMIETLERLNLKGSIEAKLIKTYQELAAQKFVQPEEVTIVEEWVKNVDQILSKS